jgi:hypothetical protein
MTASNFLSAALVALVLAAASASADEPKAAPAAKPPSAQEQAMMEKYMKAGTPGPEHQQMAKMAGKWKLQVTSWMTPTGQPMKNEGTAEFKSIMGGRFLQEEVHGQMGDQTFEGMGINGFDNVKKERFSTWVDNMGTGPLISHGKCAPEAKKCTMTGRVADPITGKEITVTETMTMKDENNFTFEMWGPGPGGKTFKTLEINYSRQ